MDVLRPRHLIASSKELVPRDMVIGVVVGMAVQMHVDLLPINVDLCEPDSFPPRRAHPLRRRRRGAGSGEVN